ncbi:MAG: hypothetical protein IKU72_05345 [Oscillospiraceae bacterium]|nr:hypothetical protein [Oscillospiraceae bacterium]
MKKLIFVLILVLVMSVVFQGCGTKNQTADNTQPSSGAEADDSQNKITEKMAYNGVYNYCRDTYDWSIAEDNPDIMSLEMGEESESEYKVVFRSYTGSFVYFYVDKSSGSTRLVEYVPNLDIEEEAGTIDLYDYLESDNK